MDECIAEQEALNADYSNAERGRRAVEPQAPATRTPETAWRSSADSAAGDSRQEPIICSEQRAVVASSQLHLTTNSLVLTTSIPPSHYAIAQELHCVRPPHLVPADLLLGNVCIRSNGQEPAHQRRHQGHLPRLHGQAGNVSPWPATRARNSH